METSLEADEQVVAEKNTAKSTAFKSDKNG